MSSSTFTIAPKIQSGPSSYKSYDFGATYRGDWKLEEGNQDLEVITGKTRPVFDFDCGKNFYASRAEQEKDKIPFIMKCNAFVRSLLIEHRFDVDRARIDIYESCGKNPEKGYVNSVRAIVRGVGCFESLNDMKMYFKFDDIWADKDHPMNATLDKTIYKNADKQQKIRLPYQLKKEGDKRFFKRCVIKNNTVNIYSTLKDLMSDEQLKVDHSDFLASYVMGDKVIGGKPGEFDYDPEAKPVPRESKSGEDTKQGETARKGTIAVKPTKKSKDTSDTEAESDDDDDLQKIQIEKKRSNLTLEDMEKIGTIVYKDTIHEYGPWWEWVRICKTYAYFLISPEEKKECRRMCKRICKLTKTDNYDEDAFMEKWKQAMPKSADQWLSHATMLDAFEKKFPEEYKQWKKQTDNPEKTFLLKPTKEHVDVAHYFIEKWGKDSVFCGNKIYTWNGKKWYLNIMGEHITRIIVNDMRSAIQEESERMMEVKQKQLSKKWPSVPDKEEKTKYKEYKADLKIQEKFGTMTRKILANLGKDSFAKSCKSMIQQLLLVDGREAMFDSNPHLLGFENGVYDLKTDTFREAKKEDMITMSVGYDYVPREEDKIKFMEKEIIGKIFVDKEDRKFNLTVMSTGLYGEQLQKLSICTGTGGNGKDVLLEIFPKRALGQYYKLAPIDILQTKIKSIGPCPELSSLDKVRWATTSEPNSKDDMKGSQIKFFTGTGTNSARGLYDDNTNKKNCFTLFLLCNDIPAFDSVDGGIKRRVIKLAFDSQFKEKHEMKNYKNHARVFEKDDSYRGDEFVEKYRMSFLHILFDYFKIFKANGYSIGEPPKKNQEDIDRFLIDCDNLMSWFVANYETEADNSKRLNAAESRSKKPAKVEKKGKSSTDSKQREKKVKIPDGYYKGKKDERRPVLLLQDVFTKFKMSDAYINATKQEKRKMTKKKFYEDLRKNNQINVDYKEKEKVYCVRDNDIESVKSKKTGKNLPAFKSVSNVLVGWVIKPSDVEVDDVEDHVDDTDKNSGSDEETVDDYL